MFRKDGTTVGNIGSSTSGLYIHSTFGTDSGLVFGAERIVSCTSTGDFEDGLVDLGYGPSGRFKDLYLSGNADIEGNLVIGTSGKGIDFSAATPDGTGTVTSEVLDDYEEGTFTPTVVGLTTAGVATYTLRSARYTKIGNIVTFELGVGWSAHTGTGILAINGLPFTPGGSRKIFTVGRMIGLTTSELGMRSWSEASSTQVRFSTTDTAGVESQINLDASVMMLYVSGTYPT